MSGLLSETSLLLWPGSCYGQAFAAYRSAGLDIRVAETKVGGRSEQSIDAANLALPTATDEKRVYQD
jgi:hypothetical protein